MATVDYFKFPLNLYTENVIKAIGYCAPSSVGPNGSIVLHKMFIFQILHIFWTSLQKSTKNLKEIH